MVDFRQVLSQQEIAFYKAQGKTEQEIQQALNEIEQEQVIKQYGQQNASRSMFTSANQDNLIKWQLELDSILERVEHMLKGDKIKFHRDAKGNHTYWVTPTDNKEQRLNEFGVAEIMRILAMYLNRNTILSNYDEATINTKMYDLGMEIIDIFYMNYEIMGLDTLAKRKQIPIIVRQLVDITHSAYLRALNGGERDSLREARQITQSENMNQMPMMPMGGQSRERGFLNPLRYLKGRII